MKTALVTGANRGLGRETARQLSERGYRVFVSARSLAKAEAAAQDLSALSDGSGLLHPLALDVSSAESIDAAAEQLTQDGVVLDALVNNAAIHYDSTSVRRKLTFG